MQFIYKEKPLTPDRNIQVTEFKKMHGISHNENVRAVGEFRGLILAT